jgi:hypothetical protein
VGIFLCSQNVYHSGDHQNNYPSHNDNKMVMPHLFCILAVLFFEQHIIQPEWISTDSYGSNRRMRWSQLVDQFIVGCNVNDKQAHKNSHVYDIRCSFHFSAPNIQHEPSRRINTAANQRALTNKAWSLAAPTTRLPSAAKLHNRLQSPSDRRGAHGAAKHPPNQLQVVLATLARLLVSSTNSITTLSHLTHVIQVLYCWALSFKQVRFNFLAAIQACGSFSRYCSIT